MPSFKSNPIGFFVGVALLLTTLAIPSVAQTAVVSGKVRDAATNEPLPFANVFINQTTIGTATDAQGNYTLKNVPAGVNEMVFSFVGYTPYQTKIQLKDGESKQLDIRLQADDIQLENVEVKGTRDKVWDKQLKKFEKVFLGTTKFAGSTQILNSWVLDFNEVEMNGKEVFSATASKPLEIENNALGYKVYYYLKSMASNADGHSITGDVRFEEMTSDDPKTIKTWNQNRMDAYRGSLRHLVKSIIDGNAQEEGFNVYTGKSGFENSTQRTAVFAAQLDKSIQLFPTKNIVIPGKSEGEFTIPVKQRLEVHYTQKRSLLKVYSDVTFPVSWLQINGGILRANANGILLNPGNVILSGAMYEARVADLLPYNYSPDQAQTAQVKSVESSIAKKLKRLEEKAYVQTDKPYYYPGERIWFKAYMNYRTPELMDSLSRVLYVELISPDKKVMQTKIVFIDGGSGEGSFALPAKIESGKYMVRAYTQWMMNYDHETFFVKSLPVLGIYERPEDQTISDFGQSITTQVKLITETKEYKPRQKIELEFALSDQAGNPVYADLSVSVTDMKQVRDVAEEKNIMNSMLFSDDEPGKGYATEIKYPVEFGISLIGQYKNKKGLPAKSTFMVLEEKSNRMLPVQTDDQGNFTVNNLQFYDSADIMFQYAGKKKKFEGTVTFKTREVPSTEKLNVAESFRVVKANDPQRTKLPDDVSEVTTLVTDVRVFEEHTEDNQLKKENAPMAYGKPDFSFTGEEIVQSSRTSLINALKGRVPGLTVVNGYLRLGGPSSFMGPSTTEPLLILDGLQITSGTTERLNQINPELVERVDVIKYGGGAIYGSRGANGVIIVTTKSGDGATDLSLGDYALVMPVMGFSKPAIFVSPDYSQVRGDVQPDYRTTIYWAPQVVTDKIGHVLVTFYAAENATRYRVVVEGVSATGEPVRGVFFMDVVK